MQNHFELFGLPVSFELNLSELDQAYRTIQNQVHPDRYVTASDAEKRVAMQWTTRANEAYQILKRPLKRAAYLCELHGTDLATESNTSMPAAFLMQQMEWREALDEIRSCQNADQLYALEQEVQSSLKSTINNIATACHQKDFALAAQLIRASMFMEKILSDIAVLEE